MSVNANYIKDKGGNKRVLFLKSVILALTTTAGTLTSGSDFIDLGHVASSADEITPNATEYRSEDGVIRAIDSTPSGKSSAVLMQSSKELIDFLSFTSRDNEYIQYAYHGYKNSKYQESFAYGRTESGFALATPGGATAMKYSFVFSPLQTATTLTTIMLAVMKASIGGATYPYVTAAVSMPANQEIVIVESP